MKIEDILLELHNLGIYTDAVWENYVHHFEKPGRIKSYIAEHSGEPANAVSARVRSKTGCRPASPDYDRSPKIVTLDDLGTPDVRNRMTLGSMSGCYDLLHISHLQAMAHARQVLAGHSGATLCCLLLSDQNIRAKKGPARPVFDINERLAMLVAVRHVDYVVPLEEPDCLAALEYLKPEYFFKSEADKTQSIVLREMDLVSSLGGSIVYSPEDDQRRLSTTGIIEKIATGVPRSRHSPEIGGGLVDSGRSSE